MKMITVEMKDETDRIIGNITALPKDFKTGSKGFYAQGKMEVDGKRYQVQIQMVEIGSKSATS